MTKNFKIAHKPGQNTPEAREQARGAEAQKQTIFLVTPTPLARGTKYRVTPTGDGDWRVKPDGASRADSIHDGKSDAIDRARDPATTKLTRASHRSRARRKTSN